MRNRLDEGTARRLSTVLEERFGSPLVEFKSDGQGIPSSDTKKDMGNRGFGAKFEQCTCGGMMELDEDVCTACGMMPTGMEDKDAEARELDEATHHPPHQPPVDPAKTWTDPTTGETRGYCNICLGRGKVKNHRGGQMICPRCRGARIITKASKPIDEADLTQKAPPGREKQVKALKKQKGVKNPWAVAWASYDKRKK